MVILCHGNEVSLEDLPEPSGRLWPEKAQSLADGGDLPSLPPEGLSLVDPGPTRSEEYSSVD
jgi:hypothetical protein